LTLRKTGTAVVVVSVLVHVTLMVSADGDADAGRLVRLGFQHETDWGFDMLLERILALERDTVGFTFSESDVHNGEVVRLSFRSSGATERKESSFAQSVADGHDRRRGMANATDAILSAARSELGTTKPGGEAKKAAKKAIAVARGTHHNDVKKKLESRDGERFLYRLAKVRHCQIKDVEKFFGINDENGDLLMDHNMF
uniref:ER membrane protein complex subunit 10 n=1 Tax=Heligmosomoides polygyrus TaxID=6339 RepID=A0A183FDJ2_HELPZ